MKDKKAIFYANEAPPLSSQMAIGNFDKNKKMHNMTILKWKKCILSNNSTDHLTSQYPFFKEKN